MGAGTGAAEVVFGSRDADFLAITPRRRPYADPSNLSDDSYDWDANWVVCLVEAKLRGFRAKFEASFLTMEFPPFRDALGAVWKDLRGEAHFTTIEEQVSLTVRGDGVGHISVRGELQDLAGMGNRLTFQLEIDQTFLGATLRQLDDLIDRFPVRRRSGPA